MIRIKKLEEPQILKENSKKWTNEYLDYIRRGVEIPDSVKKRYSHPEIRNQLIKETHRKCAYCESKFCSVEYGDIEHIKPKFPDAHPELYVTWSNLTMSCEICNRSGKRTYNNDKEPLLNPYTDEINNEIMGLGPFISWKTKKGMISIDTLLLNRTALIEKRTEAIKKIDLLLKQYHLETNESYKEILLNCIKEAVSDENEYSFVLREYLLDFCEKTDNQVLRTFLADLY